MQKNGAMKRLMLFIAALAICHTAVFPQGCLPEGITFSSQAQIDNFQTNYPGCTQIEGNVTIDGYAISNLNGLSVLTSIGKSMFIVFNDALTSLTGLNSLTSIGESISIVGNSALTSLTGLENLTSVEGYISIGGNSALTSLTGLENLTFIEDFISIMGNSALTSLTGLENLTSIEGSLQFYSNNSLPNMTGLGNLTFIGDFLDIIDNNSLVNLTGLENLTSIGGGLNFISNDALISLTGLENLASIGNSILISENNALTSLSGLDSIAASSITDLYIVSNQLLSTCEVQSICDYLATTNVTLTIEHNATGCNSQAEVIVACATIGIEEIINGKSFSIFPNPANDHLTIQLSLEKPEPVHITVLNVTGQQMALIADGQPKTGEYRAEIDISTWPVGVYFCRVQAGSETFTQKIIKVH